MSGTVGEGIERKMRSDRWLMALFWVDPDFLDSPRAAEMVGLALVMLVLVLVGAPDVEGGAVVDLGESTEAEGGEVELVPAIVPAGSRSPDCAAALGG